MSMLTLPGLELDDELVPQIKPQIVMNGDSARAGRWDRISSHEAADSISQEGLQDSRRHVLLDLRRYGRSGAGAVLRRAGERWSGSRIRTALTELEELGQVERSELTGRTDRGRRCDEFALTILGLEALEAAQ